MNLVGRFKIQLQVLVKMVTQVIIIVFRVLGARFCFFAFLMVSWAWILRNPYGVIFRNLSVGLSYLFPFL